MAYQPIWDASFDVVIEGETASAFEELVLSILDRKMMIVKYERNGPGGGNPCVTMRGTRKQLVKWYTEFYNDNVGADVDPNDETAVWCWMQENDGTFNCIA